MWGEKLGNKQIKMREKVRIPGTPERRQIGHAGETADQDTLERQQRRKYESRAEFEII